MFSACSHRRCSGLNHRCSPSGFSLVPHAPPAVTQISIRPRERPFATEMHVENLFRIIMRPKYWNATAGHCDYQPRPQELNEVNDGTNVHQMHPRFPRYMTGGQGSGKQGGE